MATLTATIAPFGTVSGNINATYCDLSQPADAGASDGGIAGCVS